MAHGRTKHNRTYKPVFIDITLGENSIEMALEDYELEDGDELGMYPQKLGASSSSIAATAMPVKVRYVFESATTPSHLRYYHPKQRKAVPASQSADSLKRSRRPFSSVPSETFGMRLQREIRSIESKGELASRYDGWLEMQRRELEDLEVCFRD